MQADGQADMTKLTAAFRNFANAPKNVRTIAIVHSTRDRLLSNVTRDASWILALCIGNITFCCGEGRGKKYVT